MAARSDEVEIADIDENVIEDVNFWLKKQRELITNQLDFNLNTLKDLAENNIVVACTRFR